MTRNGKEYGPLILRASLGLMLVSHGFLKIFAIGIPFTMRFFESQGYAGYLVYPVLLAEMGGGLLLVLGVHTRWIALLLMPTLIGAAKVHLGNDLHRWRRLGAARKRLEPQAGGSTASQRSLTPPPDICYAAAMVTARLG
jgi:hypothetical protein